MAIMTPRGLKIRLEPEWAFGLLGRLWERDSRTDAYQVMKTCEAIECIPAAFSNIAGLAVVFTLPSPIWSLLAVMVGGRILGLCLTQFGQFSILKPLGLLTLGLAWSYVQGYGILFLTMVGIVGFASNWVVAGVWILGILAGFVTGTVADIYFTKRNLRGIGESFTPAEVNFFNAYRLHADRLGVTRDFSMDEDEVASGVWLLCLRDYIMKYPKAVARFEDVRLKLAAATMMNLGSQNSR